MIPFTPFDFTNLKQQFDLRELFANRYGEGKRCGKCVKYPSPYRDDRNHSSFAVYQNGYKDYGGDGANGDVIAWVQLEYNLDFVEAITWLNDRAGGYSLPIESPPARASATTGSSEAPSRDWQHAADAASRQAEAYLWSDAGKAARLYLDQVRGLNETTLRKFHLGYFPAWTPTEFWYTDPTTAQSKQAHAAPGITIPRRSYGATWALRVRTRTGNLADFLHRKPDCIDDEALDKYLNLRGSRPNVLFNADAITDGCVVLIVEGEFDAMLGEQELGDRVAVVTFGSASAKPSRRDLDLLRRAKCVYGLFDNDKAGQDASARFAETLGDTYQALTLPIGKDITEFVVDYGGNLPAWWAASTRPTRWFQGGVPDSWRSALLNLDTHATAAPLYELVTEGLRAGLLDPDQLSCPALKACRDTLGWTLCDSAIHRGFFSVRDLFFSDLPTEKDTLSVRKSENNPSQGGRPVDFYRLLPLAEAQKRLLGALKPVLRARHFPITPHGDQPAVVADLTPRALESIGVVPIDARTVADVLQAASEPAYNTQRKQRAYASRREKRALNAWSEALTDETHTRLRNDWPIESLKAFRLNLLHVWKRDGVLAPDSGNRKIAEMLGLSIRSVKPYLERAGVDSERQPLVERRLTTPNEIEKQIRAIQIEERGRVLWLRSQAADGSEVTIACSEDQTHGFVRNQLAAGHKVSALVQIANLHTVREDAPAPVLRRRQPPETHTRVANSARGAHQSEIQRPLFSYDPDWVRGQLVLRLDILGWRHADRYINPDTGEVGSTSAPAVDLLTLLTSCEIHSADRDPIPHFA